MAQVITTDGQIHIVEESRKVIDNMIYDNSQSSIIELNRVIEYFEYDQENRTKIKKIKYKPCNFIVFNIVNYED